MDIHIASPIRLLIVESHPVQYRTPVYERLEQLCPGALHVVFASDFSTRGGHDKGFNAEISWDSNLLGGFPFTVLNYGLTRSPNGWKDLDGKGLSPLIRRLQPKAILLTSLNYRYDHIAYALARRSGIPLWMRCETQDYAIRRSSVKSFMRSIYYRLLYSGISMAFPIGELNRQHWISHGMKPDRLSYAKYCTPNRVAVIDHQERQGRRNILRRSLGLCPERLLVAFFGKLIPKKDPALLLDAVPMVFKPLLQRIALVFVGSGELQPELQRNASIIQALYGIPIFFPGFVNQMALVDWYLAADVVVLPSIRAGETWGLVVNEALQAGCSVVASEAVGCTADFGGWERFRTIPVGSALHLARALGDLACYPRSFEWASEGLKAYSVEAAAQSLASAIANLD